MIRYEIITNLDYKDKYYDQVINLLKDFWHTISKIDNFKLMQVTDKFEDEYYEYIKSLFTYDNGVLILALDNNNPIGFALGYIWNKPIMLTDLEKPTQRAELYDLYVKQDYRNKGIGTTLIRWLERYYKDLGCDYLVVGLLSNNKAYNLYKRVGFKDHIIEMMKEI